MTKARFTLGTGRVRVLIRGAGEQATGVAHRLVRAGFSVAMTELNKPLAVRRLVSFCEAVWEREWTVEGVTGTLVDRADGFNRIIRKGGVPVTVDPDLTLGLGWEPHVLVDATLAKRNLGTRREMAPLVIGFGPGFSAGDDVDLVVETMRGNDLGRIIEEGPAAPDTAVPGRVMGVDVDRVVRAPRSGIFQSESEIGMMVNEGDRVGAVAGEPVRAATSGVLRGLLRGGVEIAEGIKVGDVDPRSERSLCNAISDKARALGGATLEAVLSRFG